MPLFYRESFPFYFSLAFLPQDSILMLNSFLSSVDDYKYQLATVFPHG